MQPLPEDETWEQGVVQFIPGGVLVLYTDGITEAQNEQGAFFGEERLLGSVRANLAHRAQGIQDVIMTDVHRFVGNAPQFDDIALAVIVRD